MGLFEGWCLQFVSNSDIAALLVVVVAVAVVDSCCRLLVLVVVSWLLFWISLSVEKDVDNAVTCPLLDINVDIDDLSLLYLPKVRIVAVLVVVGIRNRKLETEQRCSCDAMAIIMMSRQGGEILLILLLRKATGEDGRCRFAMSNVLVIKVEDNIEECKSLEVYCGLQ